MSGPMKSFLYPVAGGYEPELAAPSQTPMSQPTQAAVPILADEPAAGRWVDDSNPVKASQDARESWKPNEAKPAFGTLGGVLFGGPADDGSRQIGQQTRRARGATHDLQYDEWTNPLFKRSRQNVLPTGTPPIRGAGAPMQGCVVHFPDGLIPHVPQKITMSKILTALTKKQNALIESPTGTGKSLSLLCSALAWQEKERIVVDAENEAIRQRNAEKMLAYELECAHRRELRYNAAAAVKDEKFKALPPPPVDDPIGVAAALALNAEMDSALKQSLKKELGDSLQTYGQTVGAALVDKQLRDEGLVEPTAMEITRDVAVHVIKNEPDFLPVKGVSHGIADSMEATNPAVSVKPEVTQPKVAEVKPTPTSTTFPPLQPPQLEFPKRVPKIYLCSRTHSQLHQLVKELKRTPYRPKYTILGSRKQYCNINKNDEECTEMTKNKNSASGETACGFYNKKDFVIEELQRAQIWDMEDLDKASNAHLGCQYYAMRALHKTAELILCPYNYVFDANIRNALEIDLTGNAVVIDEGHNVEDVCRDGASTEISKKDLDEMSDQLIKMSTFLPDTQTAVKFIQPLSKWVNKCLTGANEKGKFGRNNFGSNFGAPVTAGVGEMLWKGEETVGALAKALAPRTFDGAYGGDTYEAKRSAIDLTKRILQDALKVTAFDGSLMREISQNGNTYGLNAVSSCHKIAAGLISCLNNPEEYVICVTKDLNNPGDMGGGSKGRNSDGDDKKLPGVAIWCLRPAVAFRPVSSEARCVIVTSGTLSPMGSLEGELGVQFPIKVEAPHVVPAKQIHVEASDALGDFTAKAQDSDGCPKALAQLLLRYLTKNIIPGGILVFLPKYSLIRRIVERWQSDGTMTELEKHKPVVWEEPGATTLTPTLESFRENIKQGKGGIFLAVYRGKVSEGLDFKDDNARAVFCIGIPFPAVGDVKVRLKKEYNGTLYAKTQGMLSGGEWYTQTAFRAYNQALGRCVRHLHDYAAIFLVDGRFARHADAQKNKSMVSKWMRNLVQVFSSSRESVGVLSEFFQKLVENPPGAPVA